ncbi:MAG: cytochrome c oxidase subunit II [Erythrobacter sp.]
MIMSQAFARTRNGFLALMAAVMATGIALAAPEAAFAQERGEDAIAAPVTELPVIEEIDNEVEATDAGADAAPAYTSTVQPEPGKGMPTAYEDDALASMTFQDQYSPNGEYALWMHDVFLLPVITVISLFVLFLLLYVIVKFRRGANPTPSRTTHNTAIEVIWTVLPVIILVIIAVPSISLLAKQFESPPEDAITVKTVGYQWYWGYEYPDHDVEVISNMLSDADAIANGEPAKLAVDNRMVVPVGVPLRIQTTAADVIHAFAVPALWFKLDAVPGRLNEKMLIIEEPGIYYGQCSELCGARHGFMPIAVEAVPMEQFEAWVASQGGTLPAERAAQEAAEAAAAAAAEAEAEVAEEAAEEPAA